MIVSLNSVDIILWQRQRPVLFLATFSSCNQRTHANRSQLVNSSDPFLFFNKNVQPSPAHWRQHFILRLGAHAAAPPSGPVNIVFFETVPVNIVNRERTVVVSMTVQTHQVHSRTQASASFTTQMHPSFFTLIHPSDIWDPHHCQRIVN